MKGPMTTNNLMKVEPAAPRSGSMTARNAEAASPNSSPRLPLAKPALHIGGLEHKDSAGSSCSTKAAPIKQAAEVPRVAPWLVRLFAGYSRGYVRRHFHSLRVSRASALPDERDLPLVIYSNHASWWDPLVGLLVGREFLPGRTVFAPMDAAALERYGFFKRLGAFGVEQGTRRGAVQFLRAARAILRHSEHVLWLTPQSRFADVRERPVGFKSGIGHLPNQIHRAIFQPVAIEYGFWEERLPEILLRFGEPYETCAGEMQPDPRVWTEFFAGKLTETQDALAAEARQRNAAKFQCLLRGGAGVGLFYDVWRSLKAKCRGQTFQPEHGKL